jgi:hypothetical protein
MRVQLALYCSAGSNTFYFAPLLPCLVRQANYVQNATQTGTKSCVISKSGGNTIISGDFSGTAGTPTEGTLTTTLADAKQEITKIAPLKIVINFTTGNIATAIIDIDLDEFKVNTVL